LGIPVEIVQILSKLIETDNSCCVPWFPLVANCCKIVDSQTSFKLYWEIGNFGKVGVEVKLFTSDSATLLLTAISSHRLAALPARMSAFNSHFRQNAY